MSKFEFPYQMMSRFNVLETHARDGMKGLQHIFDYFTSVQKELAKFRKGLDKSLDNVRTFLKHNNKSDATLCSALKLLIRNEEGFYKEVDRMCEKYREQVLDVFKIRVDMYNNVNKKKMSIGEYIISKTEKSRGKVTKAKEEYHKNARNFFNAGTSETEQLRQNAMEASKIRYQKLIEEHNKFLDREIAEYLVHLKDLESNEQMRIDVIEKSMRQFLGASVELAEKYRTCYEENMTALRQVEPLRDVNLYSATLLRVKKQETFDKMIFEDHGEIYQLINKVCSGKGKCAEELKDDDSMEFTLKSTSTEQNTFTNVESLEKEITLKYSSLLDGKSLSEKDKGRVKETLKSSSGRLWLAEALGEVTDRYTIVDVAAFETLGELTRLMLDLVYTKRDSNPLLLYALLTASSFIYGKKEIFDGKVATISLREVLKDSPIFNDKERWISVIQYGLQKEFDRCNIELAGKEKKKSDAEREINMKKSKLYTELSSFGMKMALLNVPKEFGREILLGFAGYYELPSDKLCQLLLEYEGAQRFVRKEKLTKKDIEIIMERKRKKLLRKYENTPIIIIAKSMTYISELTTLRSILLLNKSIKSRLQRRVYRKVLALPKVSMKIRRELWTKAVVDTTLAAQYQEIKEQRVKKFLDSGRIAEDVICMDVSRSFRCLSDDDQEVSLFICTA
eukprot:TRINITY_DN7049_c0_g7_i2.p1 TRINITY_DN7049_c0_g7~~TRINITY_DN7049_c0_g7_i2.p1  ORF type:complete len:678 (+),score=207.00 TRINITY_DN7049_c0_g7_i2:180-2213(+)